MMKYMLFINIFTYHMRNMKLKYYEWGKSRINHILSYFKNISKDMLIHAFNCANTFLFLNMMFDLLYLLDVLIFNSFKTFRSYSY